jgi:hypothetical protein
MKWIAAGVLVFSISTSSFGQWQKSEKTDAFTGRSYVQYLLPGKFLAAPTASQNSEPMLVMQCALGERRYTGKWKYHGKLVKAYFAVGAVMGSTDETTGSGRMRVLFRLDDGKPKEGFWGSSTDFSALFPMNDDINTVFFNHAMPHKAGTSPPVQKLVISAAEYLAGRVVMQFDLANSEEVANSCGLSVNQD